jgi:hypothetical protein
MILPRAFAIFLGLALSACGREAAPEAAPGAVERTTDELDRNAAAERSAITDSNDRDAKERADAAARRIKSVEKGRSEGK